MAGDALQLGDQHADVAHALGHLDAEQPLDRQAERQAVRLRAEVVHPLDERDHLLPLLLLGGLLDAGVQVADRRVGVDDGLAGELQHEPQHAVRAGVLRPHVDGHRLAAKFRRRCTSGIRSPAQCRARSTGEAGQQFARSTSSQIAWSSVMCTSCTRAVDSCGTLMWICRHSAERAAVAPGQRDRLQPAAGGLAHRLDHVRRPAARRDRNGDVAGAARAPRSAARTPARTRKSFATLVSTLASVVSAMRRHPGALALEPADQLRGDVLRVGGAAAVAEHQQLPACAVRRVDQRPLPATTASSDCARTR